MYPAVQILPKLNSSWSLKIIFVGLSLGILSLLSAYMQSRSSMFHLQLWTDKSFKIALAQTAFKDVQLQAEQRFS